MLATQILTSSPEKDLEEKNNSTETVGFLVLEGKKHKIKRGDTKIGRDPSLCSIVIDNFTVSKVHSIIESEGKEDTFICDVGSTNLTKLGKKILKPHYRYKLENGSIVTFGNVIGTVDLATEEHENPAKFSQTDSTAFKIGGLVSNYNSCINGDIFDLETQVSQLPRGAEICPSASTNLSTTSSLKNHRHSKDTNFSFLPKGNDKCKETHTSYFKNVLSLKSPAKPIIYGSFEDSNIFNMMTQEQIYSPKTNSQNSSNTEVIITKESQDSNTVKSLLDDDQDDIFCNFENLKFLNKENTSTPLKMECAPSTSENKESFGKSKLGVSKSLQNDLEIDREIDLIRNDVEINRSFDEEFFCETVDSSKVFRELIIQENEYHSSIKLIHNVNISEAENISNNFTRGKEKETFARIKKSSCNGNEKNMSQLTAKNFNLRVDPTLKTISPPYLEVTISDEFLPKINNDIRHNTSKNCSSSQCLNESSKYNNSHESIKNLNNTFQYQSVKCSVNHKENVVHDDFPKSIKKELQMISDTLDDETESFLKIVLENVENKNFDNSISSQLTSQLTLKKITDQDSTACNTKNDIANLNNINKNCYSQNLKIALNEQLSSDSDEFIASQVIKSQASSNTCEYNSEETQIDDVVLKSLAVNDFHDQKFQHSELFVRETNTNWSLDFIQSTSSPGSTQASTRKNLFKGHLKNSNTNSPFNQEYQKIVTPLTQTKDLNAFVPESSEDDNTPSDLEIIEDSPFVYKKSKVDIQAGTTEMKEEPDSINLNQSNRFEGNENENSETSYIFDIDDFSEHDKHRDNNTNFTNHKRLSGDCEDNKNKIFTEYVEHKTQFSDSETPDLIIGVENILSEKQFDSDALNQKFNLYEDVNSDEIIRPNTQILEETLTKIIEEDNKENKKQSSCSGKPVQNEKEIRNFFKDLSPGCRDDSNKQSESLKESPRKRILCSEISTNPAKKIKKNLDMINHDAEDVSRSKEEILNFWQVPDIAHVVPQKATIPKCVLSHEKGNKVDNLLYEEFNGNSAFALNKISFGNQTEKITEADSSRSKARQPTGRKSERGTTSKRDSASEEVSSEVTQAKRVLRSVSKHYGSSIVPQNQMVTSCVRNLLNEPSTETLKKHTTRARASLKKNQTSMILNNESYFLCLPVNVVFTGFDSPCLDKIIEELGGSRTDDLKSGHAVVTDRVRRTVKFMCAIGLSLPIVSPDWLLTSKKENKFLNPWKFILKDEESEDRWDFDLENALKKAKRKKFLQNFHVFATESVKPPPKDMLLIAECCGAIPLIHPSENWPKKTLILTCEEDKASWPPPKVRSVKILHFEFLLSGVLQQQTDFKIFQLR